LTGKGGRVPPAAVFPVHPSNVLGDGVGLQRPFSQK